MTRHLFLPLACCLVFVLFNRVSCEESAADTSSSQHEASNTEAVPRVKRAMNMLRLGRGLQMLRLGKRSMPMLRLGRQAPTENDFFLADLLDALENGYFDEDSDYVPVETYHARYRRSTDTEAMPPPAPPAVDESDEESEENDQPVKRSLYSPYDDQYVDDQLLQGDEDESTVEKRPMSMLRLGKRPMSMLRLGKRPMSMLRLGKRPMSMLRLGKRPMSMLRLGKREDDTESEFEMPVPVEEGADNLSADKRPMSMLRLGKRPMSMLRLGKRPMSMLRLGKRPMSMLRLGKRPMSMLRLGKRPMSMLRLGKRNAE